MEVPIGQWWAALQGAYGWATGLGPLRELLVGAILLAALAISWLRGREQPVMSDRKLPPLGARFLLMRIFESWTYKDPLKLGNRAIEYFENHLGIVAMSGGFKTTLMAQIADQRIRAGESVVCLTGGDSDQLEEVIASHGGLVIRPSTSPATFNAFDGDAKYRAQTWATLFPTNSEAKVYHSAFELAGYDYFKQDDLIPSVAGLADHVKAYAAERKGKLWDGMSEGYVSIRLERVEQFLGDWIGHEISVSDAASLGIPIMFVCDPKELPDLSEFASALVWRGICHAVYTSKRPGTAIVDELGRLPFGLVGDEVRTWRRNRWHLVVGTHAGADFVDILGDLIHVWVLGRMTASAVKTRAWARELTWRTVPMENFGAHALERAFFYLIDLKRVQTVKVPLHKRPKQWKRSVPFWKLLARAVPAAVESAGPVPPSTGKGTDPERTQGPMPMPPIFKTERDQQIWLRYRYPEGMDGCHELAYYANKKTNRSEIEWRGQSWMVYNVVRTLWDLFEMGLEPESPEASEYVNYIKFRTKTDNLTCQHDCDNVRCARRDHIRWLDRVGNVQEQWVSWRARKDAAKAA